MIKMLNKCIHISTQKALKTCGFGIPVNIALPNISNNYYPHGYSLNSSFLISHIRMIFI
jgi:hypothetical protein